MAISKNSKITAVDFNAVTGVGTEDNALQAPTSALGVSAQAGIIWGSGWGDRGWGQWEPSLPNVAKDQPITHLEWGNLVTIQNRAADRTGASILRYVAPKKDDPIIALSALASNNQAIDYKRFSIPESDYKLTALLAQNVRAAPWSTTITATCQIDWANSDTARWWFNSGSQIVLRLNHNTNATPQDTAWNQALTALGDIRIGAHQTTWGTDQSIGIGYWQLDGTNKNVINQVQGTGAYSGDLVVTVSLTRGTPQNLRGDNSARITASVILTDNHTGFADLVTGGYTRLQVFGNRSTRHFTPLGPASITFPQPF